MGGGNEGRCARPPLSPTLSRKGRGSPSADASLTCSFREVSTLPGLPPPLRGRVGERGKLRALLLIETRQTVDMGIETIGAA